MEYFNIYKKRVNKYGSTHQDRIQGKKEHDFEVFMKKSPNLVRARDGEDGEFYDAVLQTKEYDQDEVTDYLLVPLSRKIPMGTIIYTEDSRHTEVFYEEKPYSARRWINYAVDPYTSTGYNRYTVVELESELSWVLDGIKYTSFAHATGGGSGARDKNINAKFKVQFSESGVYLPNKRYSIVMPTNEHMKKNMKVTLGNETWKVVGFDNISVKGVSYVTLEEALTDEREDIPVANYSEFKNWTVTTSLGDNFTIPRVGTSSFELVFFYKNELKEEVKFSVAENDLYTVVLDGNQVKITAKTTYLGPASIKVFLEGWEGEDFIEIPFNYSSSTQEEISIVGPESLYVGDTVDYIIHYTVEEEIEKAILENNTAKIISSKKENSKLILTIKGLTIGKNKIITNTKEFSFEVLSMWLGGR